MRTDPVIAVDGLSRRFGEVVAVDHLALEVYPGEVFGFLGHNGAGKTTTVRLLNGVLAPDSGTSRVLELDPLDDGPALRRRTGVLTETPSLDERLTGRENLEIYAELYDVPRSQVRGRVAFLLEAFELDHRADDKVGGYSRGMKQRLALARALLHEPEILFLDEPTSGVDPLARREFWARTNALAETGITILVTTHFMEEANYCDRLVIMAEGEVLAEGTPQEIKHRTRRPGEPEPSMEDAFIALIEQHGAAA